MHKRILALDLGDQWVGVALSDPLGLTAKPYQTIEASQLESFLTNIFQEHALNTVVIGYPLTLRGTESEQTKKIRDTKQLLAERFPQITFVLYDERLTSKQADALKKAKTKEEKRKQHAVAAAFILQSYLDYAYQQQQH